MRIVIGFFLLLLHSLVLAQAPMDVHVESSVNSNDRVGPRLVYVIREKLRESNGLRLIDDKNNALIRLSIATLDPDINGNNAGERTAYSIAFTFRPPDRDVELFLTHSVGTCGRDRIEYCALGIVSQMDSFAVEHRQFFK